MLSYKTISGQLPRISRRSRGQSRAVRRYFHSQHQTRTAVASRRSRNAGLMSAVLVGGGFLYAVGYPRSLEAETMPAPAEIKFEEPRKKATSREDNRDLISSQHLQVKKSWENPGVYVWGSNTGKPQIFGV